MRELMTRTFRAPGMDKKGGTEIAAEERDAPKGCFKKKKDRSEKTRNSREMIKKIINVLLAAALSISLIACGGAGAADSGKTANNTADQKGSGQAASAAGKKTGAAGESSANGSTTPASAESELSMDDIDFVEEPYKRDDGGISMDVFAMDTYMNILAYGDRAEEAVIAAAAEIHRIDDMLSTGNAESEISKLNAAGGGEVSDITLELIEKSKELYQSTGGLFNIALYPVMKLWGFPTQEYRIPEKEELEAALKIADPSAITVGNASAAGENAGIGKTAAAGENNSAGGTAAAGESDSAGKTAAAGDSDSAGKTDSGESSKTQITFEIEGMEIDLGGIAKGYTSSRVMEVFKEYGIEHGLVSLGGNVQALGSKAGGAPWRVAVQNPESELNYLGILDIVDKCVITSGGYERFFEKDGVRYHHIIDPRVGYPADSGIISSTIISEDGTLADGLSTSFFIMGLEEAKEYWRANSDKFDFILEDSDGILHVSEGAAEILSTEMDKEIVKK